MMYHKLQYRNHENAAKRICKYFSKYGEVEIQFSDLTTLICIYDSQKCTWWYENYAYNDPKEQSVYLDTDEICNYISEAIRRKEAKGKTIDKVIISRYGEDLHTIKFRR